MTEGVDFSFGRPGSSALLKAGKTFVLRYLDYPGAGGKGISKAELTDLTSHGIAVAFLFESTANRALSGKAAGQTDGQLAANAMTALGLPTGLPVYFAVDFDASAAQLLIVDQYLGGAAGVLGAGMVGVYGGIRTVDHCLAKGTAHWGFQTYAWSAGRVSSNAHVLQYLNGQTINGAAVDLCRALKADFGQFPRPQEATLIVPTDQPLLIGDLLAGGAIYAEDFKTSLGTSTATPGVHVYGLARPRATGAALIPIAYLGKVGWVGVDKLQNLRLPNAVTATPLAPGTYIVK